MASTGKRSISDVLVNKAPKRPRSSATLSFTLSPKAYVKSGLPTTSVVIALNQDAIRPGDFFPAKLAITFGMAKILCGALVVTFGVMSMLLEAAMSGIGAGMWSGIVILVSGIFGIMSGKRPQNSVYLISFMCMSILSLAVAGLLVIFSAMGLIRDQNHPLGFYMDDRGNRVEFLGEVPLKSPAIAINTVLVILGILSLFLALGAAVICGREACQCYNVSGDESVVGVDSVIRRHRIMSWLGQQATDNTFIDSQSTSKHRVYPMAIGIIPRAASSKQMIPSVYQSRPSMMMPSRSLSSSSVHTELTEPDSLCERQVKSTHSKHGDLEFLKRYGMTEVARF